LHSPEVESKSGLATVTVIVLNHNGKRLLPECFHSLVAMLNYPKERLQLIMVDNGPTDGSVEHMKANFECFERADSETPHH